MSKSEIQIPQEKITQVISLATQLALQNENNISKEDLIKAGIEAGISAEYMQKAIVQIDNEQSQSFQCQISGNQTLKNQSNQQFNQRYLLPLIGTWLGLMLQWLTVDVFYVNKYSYKQLLYYPIIGLLVGGIGQACFDYKKNRKENK